MKANDFIMKYSLNHEIKFNHFNFMVDLSDTFVERLIKYQAYNNQVKIKITIKEMHDLWISISNKSQGELPKSLWNFFYVKIILFVINSTFESDDDLKNKIKNELIQITSKSSYTNGIKKL